MNPFYDISEQTDLPNDALQLNNLGSELVIASIGKTTRDGWGGRNMEWIQSTAPVQPEDYDKLFAKKLYRTKPVYNVDKVLDHHFGHYCSDNSNDKEDFFKHMRYVVLPILKKLSNSEVCISLLEQWLEEKSPIRKDLIPNVVNHNSINVGTVNAPTQFQQNSDHSVQTQHNGLQKEQIEEFLNTLRNDIEQLDENIRRDFAMEMDYAAAQLAKNRDAKPQLLTMGSLMKDVGVSIFSNVVASPFYPVMKSLLGLPE